ncbi:MrcB family domain-containing protein [Pararhodobacter aggregans]
MISGFLRKIATEYSVESTKEFKNSRFGDFVRHDVAIEARKMVSFWPFDLSVKASVGAGNWAGVPWLAFLDPIITTSATSGFYVVFLINAKDETIILSLNQGATAIHQEFGVTRGKDVLKRRARDMADRVPEFAAQFSEDAISLGALGDLPSGYEAGHSFGRVYTTKNLNDARIAEDLELMLLAYEALVNRGGTTPSEVMQEESGSLDAEETRKYVLSRRIERSPKVRKGVLSHKPPICECCGLNPKTDYGFIGPNHETPLDVHHVTPLFGLAEGETRRYKIPEDFIVLCPTCHRMIHKGNDPSDLEALKRRLRFKIAREVGYFSP